MLKQVRYCTGRLVGTMALNYALVKYFDDRSRMAADYFGNWLRIRGNLVSIFRWYDGSIIAERRVSRING